MPPNTAVAFRTAAARHRLSSVYTQAWITGQRLSFPLNNDGYLQALQILLQLTVNVTGVGTVSDPDTAISNYLPTIDLRSPQGEQVWAGTNSQDIFDFNYRLNRSVRPQDDPSYATWAPGVGGNQTVNLRLNLPVSVNDGNNFDFGLLQRQISNNKFNLVVQCAALADLVGTGTCVATITGNVIVEEVYYDAVPDVTPQGMPDIVPPNFDQYIRLRSQTAPNALANGQNVVPYDTGPVLMDAFHRLIRNGAGDATIANLTSIELKANSGNQIEFRTGNRLAYDVEQHLGKALRAGVYQLDFADDTESVNETKARDLINSNLATNLKQNIQYGGVAAGIMAIKSFYREIVTFGA